MQPTIGRIVHYKTLVTEKYPESITVAAIITKVNEDGSVLITKFAPNAGAQAMKKRGVTQGDEPGQWNWPPKV